MREGLELGGQPWSWAGARIGATYKNSHINRANGAVPEREKTHP